MNADASKQKHRENNLDFVRVAAAFMVIVGHQCVLFGLQAPAALGSGIHTLGVKIFFVISGYLVTRSWDNDPNLLRFALRRALRIWPALLVVCLVTVFLLGPVISTYGVLDYFSNVRTLEYFYNIVFYITYYLPGVFEINPVKFAVNGSLWSLPSELSMYVLVAIAGLVLTLRLNGVVFWAGLFAAMVALDQFLVARGGAPIVVYATSVNATVTVGLYFVAGALLWKCSRYHRPRLDIGILTLFMLLLMGQTARSFVGSLLFAYAVLSFGLASTPGFRAAGRYGDFSYGLYLYAYPIQQVTWQIFELQRGFWVPLAIVTAVTAICAYVSWHFVERPALTLKPRKSKQINRAHESKRKCDENSLDYVQVAVVMENGKMDVR